MENIFLNDFKKDTKCVSCNKVFFIIKNEYFIQFSCKECEILVEILKPKTNYNSRIEIYTNGISFAIEKNCNFYLATNGGGKFTKHTVIFNDKFTCLSEINTIEELYKFCIKTKNNLLFL